MKYYCEIDGLTYEEDELRDTVLQYASIPDFVMATEEKFSFRELFKYLPEQIQEEAVKDVFTKCEGDFLTYFDLLPQEMKDVIHEKVIDDIIKYDCKVIDEEAH